MHVEHLLQDESLGLRLLWAENPLLRREISGVTVTDLEDPARFVRPGEAVLSGLVWWRPESGRDTAERFVAALRNADAAVLLAGEETHGAVPGDLVDACARHGVPVAGVPAHIMFRAITETVYLRQWGELSRRHALPDAIRSGLHRLVARGAAADEILAAAFAHLGGSTAYVVSATGRTVAATDGAPALPADRAAALPAGDTGVTVPVETDSLSPYERWYLHLPDADAAPPRLLHEIAAFLRHCQEARARHRAARRPAADRLGALLAASGAEPSAVRAALDACGLTAQGPHRVLVADAGARDEGLADGLRHDGPAAGPRGAGGPRREGPAEGALAEAAAHAAEGPAAVGRLPDGVAFAVLPDAGPAALADIWPLVTACAPDIPLHAGTGSPAREAQHLTHALAEARYALASARTTAPHTPSLTDATTLTTLDTLLTGVPAEVRTAYGRAVLGPLLTTVNASTAVLLHTLETFLAHDGSWARTAEVLHLHVNTVHYRVQRIEHFTGRDLSRLSDRLDLWAALLCRPDGSGAAATTAGAGRA
ncbi:PucR family transcriptional regulator [Streptomyces sp. Tue6028]|uniref:PucR family transcriptional regulator n=1 Tax=Streptomyces sp. Tue6028 TaxID=2036037 RepID=UPI003EBCB486